MQYEVSVQRYLERYRNLERPTTVAYWLYYSLDVLTTNDDLRYFVITVISINT